MDAVTLKQAKNYADKLVQGLGALKGADCRIESVTPTQDGNDVVFSWIGTSGTKETTTLSVKDGVSIDNVIVDVNNNVIVEFSDGTSIIAGAISTIKGDKGDKGDTGNDGFSPTVTITNATAMHTVSITDTNGVQSFVVKDGTPVDMQDYYTKTEINAQLNVKADKTDIPVVPTNLSAFSNDTAFINNTVDNLVNYYKKTETYTQSEINTLISNINKLTTEIVQTLPTSSISTSTIYLVPVSGKQDVYSQYMYINSTWALLGETTIDLTNFYTKTEVDNKLSSKADIASIPVVPTDISAFNNDAGYITGYTETDPTVPAWAKQATKPTYTAQEVGALPDNTVIPVFTNKSVLDKITSANVNNWDDAVTKSHEHSNKSVLDKFSETNGTVLYDGNVISGQSEIDDSTTTATDKTWSAKHIDETITSALANKADSSDIPTKTSELTNDSGFITSPDGGDADTFDGKHASEFGQNLGLWDSGDIKDKILGTDCSGFVLINSGVSGMPFDSTSWFGVVQRYSDNIKGILVYRFGSGMGYNLIYLNGTWIGWKGLADGGNAASVNGYSIEVTDVDPGEGVAMATGKIVMVVEP